MSPNKEILDRAMAAWHDAARFRENRERLKRYTFGDQWSDNIIDSHGRTHTESLIVKGQGKQPATINMLRPLVRVLLGRFRNEAAEQQRYDPSPDSIDARNALPELDARALEEFIISGCAVQRIVAEKRPGGRGIWIDNVSPRHFFANTFFDPRGADIDLIGMFHYMTWPQFLNRFGHNSPAKLSRLKSIFSACAEQSLLDTPNNGKIRIAEIWNLDAKPDPAVRARFKMTWRCRFVAPDGTVLSDNPSYYAHGSHPFAVQFYPLIDGEIHSFIEDLIDRQRSLNRMLTSFEATVSTAAKGALLFPIDQLVKGWTISDIATLWSRPDSIIPVNGRGNAMPQQLVVSAESSGIVPIIEMQLKLLDQTSGLNDAIMGRALSGTISADMYKTLMANASAGIADLLGTFKAFLSRRDALISSTLKSKNLPPKTKN